MSDNLARAGDNGSARRKSGEGVHSSSSRRETSARENVLGSATQSTSHEDEGVLGEAEEADLSPPGFVASLL